MSLRGSGCGSLKTAVEDFLDRTLRASAVGWLALTCLGTADATSLVSIDALVFVMTFARGRCAGRANAPGFVISLTVTAEVSLSTSRPFFFPVTCMSSFATGCRVVLLTSPNTVRLAAAALMPPTCISVDSAGVDFPRECRAFPAGNWGSAFSSRTRRALAGRCGCRKICQRMSREDSLGDPGYARR